MMLEDTLITCQVNLPRNSCKTNLNKHLKYITKSCKDIKLWKKYRRQNSLNTMPMYLPLLKLMHSLRIWYHQCGRLTTETTLTLCPSQEPRTKSSQQTQGKDTSRTTTKGSSALRVVLLMELLMTITTLNGTTRTNPLFTIDFP